MSGNEKEEKEKKQDELNVDAETKLDILRVCMIPQRIVHVM